MNIFAQFFDEYASTVLYTALTAIIGGVGVMFKHLITRYIRNKTKKRVVKNCIRAVEQVYKDRTEEEQYEETVRAVSETLAGKGIYIAEVETMLRIEAEQIEERKGA